MNDLIDVTALFPDRPTIPPRGVALMDSDLLVDVPAVLEAEGELRRALARERERVVAAQRQRVLHRMLMRALFGGEAR